MGKVGTILEKLRSPTVLTIVLITGCYLVFGWVIAIIGPALDDFQDEFGVSVDRVSLVTACLFIGMMVGDIIATWLLERPNKGNTEVVPHRSFFFRALTFMGGCGRGNIPQAVLLQGVTVMSSFFFLISISTHGWTFGLVVICFLGTGMGGSLIDISANTIVSALDPEVAGSLLNLLHLGFGIGATMAPYIFALFHMGKKYHVAFLVVAVGGAVMFLLLHFFLPRASKTSPTTEELDMEGVRIEKIEIKEEKEEEKEEKEEKPTPKAKTKEKASERSSASLLGNAQPEAVSEDHLENSGEVELVTSSDAIVAEPGVSPLSLSSLTPAPAQTKRTWEFRHLLNFDFAMLMVSILSYNGAEIIIGEWAYDLMEEIGHVKYGTAATSLFWAGLLSGRLANSVLGQKFAGLKGTFLLLRISIVGAIAFPVLVVIFPTPPFSLVLFYASGLAYGGIFPFIVTIVAEVFKDTSGSTATALGSTFLCGNFGATVFPYIAGFIASHATVRTGMALAPLALLIVGFGILCVWWKVKARF
eukprot:Phypoly_transcript_07391.p1 GENE.Phypoly_transcript_07391~~Phypoly_transcript_07391.p1  ORF type:complete len:530 (+),score=81.70 Phypoly_transcript_07391:37-1626(+)